MEEEEIKQKLPDIYTSITKLQTDECDWKKVIHDISSLNWLENDHSKLEEICRAAWLVCENYVLDLIDDLPRFKVVRCNKIRIFVTQIVYNYSLEFTCKRLNPQFNFNLSEAVSKTSFFKKAKSILAISDEAFTTKLIKINEVYKDWKKTLASIFRHLDYQMYHGSKIDMNDMLDREFYNEVIIPFKEKLESDIDAMEKLGEYWRTYESPPIIVVEAAYNISNSTTNNSQISYHVSDVDHTDTQYGGDPTICQNQNQFCNSNSYSSYLNQNFYEGEIDSQGKRSGYGKIKYSNGDTYEGN